MHDQAENLRRMMRIGFGSPRTARVLAVTSGKGGVGKTNIAVNCGIELARMGWRIIILDVDLGLANIDVVMDLNARYNLGHVIRGEKKISDILVTTGGAVSVVPGGSGLVELANLTDGQRNNLIRSFDTLSSMADILIVDTAAGVSRNVIGFASAADEVIVVATPEPTSITDAYATIKLLIRANFKGKIDLVVNMAANSTEANRVAARIVKVAMQFLRARVYYIGYIERDQAVVAAVQRRRPFVIEQPRSRAAAQVRRLVTRLAPDDSRAVTQAETAARDVQGGFIRRLMRTFGRIEVS